MAKAGKCTDITVAYPALGKARIGLIARLSKAHAVRVAVDSKFLMDELSDAAVRNQGRIGIHIMFDAGLHRCGVADKEELLALARYARDKKGLCFEGIQLYLGHLYGDAANDPKSFEKINASWNPAYETLCSPGYCRTAHLENQPVDAGPGLVPTSSAVGDQPLHPVTSPLKVASQSWAISRDFSSSSP